MKFFAVLYTYDPTSELIATHRPAHREFIGKLNAAGQILGSGPFPDDEGGALIVIKLDEGAGVEDAAALMDGDPFYAEGAVNKRAIRPWNPVINSFE